MRHIIEAIICAVITTAVILATATVAVRADTTLSRCYVETSVAGTFLRAGDREATGSIGGGCDFAVNDMVLGAGIRGDFGDIQSGAAFVKLGYALNPHLTAYGLAAWVVPEWKIKDAGALHLGAGAETSVQAIKGLSLFAEASAAAAKTGTATRDDVLIRGGLRFRF